ncbi:MAG: tRNA uridine-5-carboxymethylaminomethyl(34) synthesis GTPase MnmE [Pseudomonadota bacterium]
MDTIFALASARGKAGISVVRISGPVAWNAVESFQVKLPRPRVSGLRRLIGQGGLIDQALVLCFSDGESFTGERSAELHLHGSPAVLDAVLMHLSKQPGLRLAEPGEFTRRALEDGRLDLAQVEGLRDLIEAETEAQRRQAVRVMDGALGDLVTAWRKELISAVALLEVTIDFVDEETPIDVASDVLSGLRKVRAELRKALRGIGAAERVRDGFEVAIVGPPNVGKSTLLNALAGRDAALTSDIAGTTRDIVEVRMDVQGLPVMFLDTAGLRATRDVVESLGIERTLDRATAADLRVFLRLDDDFPLLMEPRADDILLWAKSDLRADGEGISGLTGQGLEALVVRIGDIFRRRASQAGPATQARHRVAMTRAVAALDAAEEEILHGAERAELAAENLHVALRALNSLIGHVDVEHILDDIFSRFCLGK